MSVWFIVNNSMPTSYTRLSRARGPGLSFEGTAARVYAPLYPGFTALIQGSARTRHDCRLHELAAAKGCESWRVFGSS